MVPLSFAQRRSWFMHKFDDTAAAHNVTVALRVAGRLDVAALAGAVRDVVARHDSLRTTFVEDDDARPGQRVLPMGDVQFDVPVLVVEPRRVAAAVAEVSGRRFDLTAEIPVRACLLASASDDHVLVLVTHRIAADDESIATVARDLAAAYSARIAGRRPQWAEPAASYADYAVWQRKLLGDESDPTSPQAAQAAYWQAELAGVPSPLPLPTDRPHPPAMSHRRDLVEFAVDPTVLAAAERLAADRGVTVEMVFQAALAVLLGQLGCGTDIPLGTPVAGRARDTSEGSAGKTFDGIAGLVGPVADTWLLRVDLAGNTSFADLLHRVRAKSVAAAAHRDVPFARLVEVLDPERSLAYHPLFQVMLTVTTPQEFSLPGLLVSREPAPGATAMVDLDIRLMVGPDASGAIDYAADLFDRASVVAMADRLLRVVRQVVADPDLPVATVDVLTPAERTRLTHLAGTATDPPEVTVAELARRRSAAFPDAIAVECGATVLTYRELHARANRLARHLAAEGIGPESVVGVSLPRTADLVTTLLGILVSGAAYLPIDPRYPSQRLGFMLSDAAPDVIITDRDTRSVLPDTDRPCRLLDDLDLDHGDGTDLTDADRVAPLRPDNTAYLMYTSGSTGTPKGVAITHATVVNDIRCLAEVVGLRAGSRMLAATSINFDVSVFEIFTALTTGATLDLARDILELGERRHWTGSTLHTVPSIFTAVLDQLAGKVDVDTAVFAGDALSATLARRVRAAFPDVRVVNAYGQTESFYATAYVVPADLKPPIIVLSLTARIK
ncbi:condensation domain-containing protein [Kutzneria sp. 744]|uniref:non-ribosomal peptide synthetase n=1 Tax=Kutzneria sp. (strain 744) TaxID=345341 RepID=UPI0003EED90D|nr:condensation domain-containing protein [Kutzneria sp. 744]EWM18586.1 non-ribosomal peptide synthetase [Kutzneria sp. 744]